MRVVSLVALGAVLAIGARDSPAQVPGFSGAIVFERDAGGGSDLYVADGPGDTRPLVVSPAQEFDPSLSPRGRLAFARADDTTSDLRALVTGRETALTRDAAIDAHPAWAPDERSVVYASDSGKGFDLKTVQVGNPNSARVLVARPGDDITPAWSRSQQIVFANNASGSFDLFLRDGRKVTRLSGTADDDTSPAWSPDGRRVAFTRTDPKGNSDIYVLTLATRRLVPLTRDKFADSDPAWSPDGTQVAFVSDRDGTPAIWRVSARGGRPSAVSAGPQAIDLGPTWGRAAPAAPRQRLASVMQVGVTCPAPPHQYAGKSIAETLNGTEFDDVICGGGGNDVIHGRGGKDRLAGGDGDDRVYGDDGDDFTLLGGAGADYVFGGNGNDASIAGGDRADRHYGNAGGDKLFNADAFADLVDCGLGFDRRQPDSGPADKVFGCEAFIA